MTDTRLPASRLGRGLPAAPADPAGGRQSALIVVTSARILSEACEMAPRLRLSFLECGLFQGMMPGGGLVWMDRDRIRPFTYWGPGVKSLFFAWFERPVPSAMYMCPDYQRSVYITVAGLNSLG